MPVIGEEKNQEALQLFVIGVGKSKVDDGCYFDLLEVYTGLEKPWGSVYASWLSGI